MRRTTWIPVLGIVLLVTACGSDAPDDVAETTEEPSQEPDEPEEEADEPQEEEPEAADEPDETDEPDELDETDQTDEPEPSESDAPGDVSVADSELGEILVDSDGMTLYLFTNDSEGQSVCEDGCAAAWPPLVVDDAPVAGDGVDPSMLDTTERGDGSTQITYAGWPLYTWAQDQQPGDVTGQGVQDVWYVVSPDGEAIMEADATEPVRNEDGY